MSRQWDVAATARKDFVELIESLESEQRNQETLCAGWTPVHILAHLVSFVDVSLWSGLRNLIQHKFDTDAATMATTLKLFESRSVDDLCSTLRIRAARSAGVPGVSEALVVADVAVHTQDVRRGVSAEGSLNPTVLRSALEFVLTNKKAQKMFHAPKLDGLSFEATDVDYSAGSGAVIRGTGDAILLGLLGRPTLGDLSGRGLATLADRLKI